MSSVPDQLTYDQIPCDVDWLLEYYQRLSRLGLIDELGERGPSIIPSLQVYSLAANLFLRSVNDLVTETKVLDIGCGLGYGANLINEILSKRLRARVTGIDIDEDLISKAKRFFPDMDYRVIDAVNLSVSEIGRERFDLIVISEVIEHLSDETSLKLLSEAVNLLTDSGMLVVSTPVREVYDLFVHTPEHINELSVDEFLSTLEAAGLRLIGLYGVGKVDVRAVRLLSRLGLWARSEDRVKEFRGLASELRRLIFRLFFPGKYRCGAFENPTDRVRCLIEFNCPVEIGRKEVAIIQVGVAKRSGR